MEEKKLLNELTTEELKELYKVNKFLQEQASETAENLHKNKSRMNAYKPILTA